MPGAPPGSKEAFSFTFRRKSPELLMVIAIIGILAAMLLTIEAALTLKKDKVYQAAMLDPHTAAELPIDKIIAMCDDLIEAHGDMLPRYR